MDNAKLNINRGGAPQYTFLRPKIVGFYSIDSNMKLSYHAHNLKYVRNIDPTSNTDFDLNVGFDSYIAKPVTTDNEEKINSLLDWLVSHAYLSKIINLQAKHSTYICFRGLLGTIMRTPYEQQEGWLISATKVKNLIFLCSFYTDEKKIEIQRGQTEKERRFEYWGRKFESYMLVDKPDILPNISNPVDANEEFCMVYRSNLNHRYDIIYGAEVDGVESKIMHENPTVKTLNKLRFVELKTTRIIENERQRRNFARFKLLKWWVQSSTVGIDKIICGERDDYGFVKKVTDYKTDELPQKAWGWWYPQLCMAMLQDFLSFVEENLKQESDFSVWRFDWIPRDNHVKGRKVTDPDTYEILPDWFIKECNKCCDEQN